jgi:hypothetical protein
MRNPTGSPVAAAASRLTVPHCSCGQTSRGSGTPGATWSFQSSIHTLRCTSYSGAQWLAL